MTRMLRFAWAFAASMLLATPAFAEPSIANPTAKAVELSQDLTKIVLNDSLFADMKNTIWLSTQKQLKAKNPKISDKQLDAIKTMLDDTIGKYSDMILSKYSGIYANYFTEEELTGILDFYKTPVGQKMIETQPKLFADLMPQLMKDFQTELPKMQQEFVAKLKKASAPAGK